MTGIGGAALGELSAEESKMVEDILEVWKAILKVDDITDETDFFSLGAGSMDVVRLVEEVKDKAGKTVLKCLLNHLP